MVCVSIFSGQKITIESKQMKCVQTNSYRFKAAFFVAPILPILTFFPSSDEPPLTELVASMLLPVISVAFVSISRLCFGFTNVFGRCAAWVFGFGGLFNALLKCCCRSKFRILADGDSDDEAVTLLPFWFAFSAWSKFSSNFKLCGGDLSSTGTIYDNILIHKTQNTN